MITWASLGLVLLIIVAIVAIGAGLLIWLGAGMAPIPDQMEGRKGCGVVVVGAIVLGLAIAALARAFG